MTKYTRQTPIKNRSVAFCFSGFGVTAFWLCVQYAAKEFQQALDILDGEEPASKKLLDRGGKEDNGSSESAKDWDMSPASVSHWSLMRYKGTKSIKLSFSLFLWHSSSLVCFRSAAPFASCAVKSTMPWTTDYWPPPATKRPWNWMCTALKPLTFWRLTTCWPRRKVRRISRDDPPPSFSVCLLFFLHEYKYVF